MVQKSSDTLFHYTTLEKLALILSSKSMMFRPLTEMDDLLEDPGDPVAYGRYVFVSSWMKERTESIAMWNLYSNMESGIRIEMVKNPFQTYIITAQKMKEAFPDATIQGEFAEAIVPFEQWMGKDYSLLRFRADQILEKVEYVDDPRELTKSLVTESNGQTNIQTMMFGRYKSRYWEFQNEERYVLRFVPVDYRKIAKNEYDGDDLNRILKGPSKVPDRFFLKFGDDAFKNMRITVSPHFTEGNRLLLDAVVDKYNSEIKIQDSDLKRKIR